MTTLRISITKEVLEATKDCLAPITENCAIAYAVRKIWPLAAVGPFCIGFIPGTMYAIHHNQVKFLNKWDVATPAERAAMQPFSFDIEVPDEVIGEVNIEEIRDIIKNSKTLELV